MKIIRAVLLCLVVFANSLAIAQDQDPLNEDNYIYWESNSQVVSILGKREGAHKYCTILYDLIKMQVYFKFYEVEGEDFQIIQTSNFFKTKGNTIIMDGIVTKGYQKGSRFLIEMSTYSIYIKHLDYSLKGKETSVTYNVKRI
jgi:hypothetical protein